MLFPTFPSFPSFCTNIGRETTRVCFDARVDDGEGEGESGERRREISRWHNQWTIRPVDSINPCYGAGLRVATTLTINSTRINVNRWHCAARLSRLVKTVGAWRATKLRPESGTRVSRRNARSRNLERGKSFERISIRGDRRISSGDFPGLCKKTGVKLAWRLA